MFWLKQNSIFPTPTPLKWADCDKAQDADLFCSFASQWKKKIIKEEITFFAPETIIGCILADMKIALFIYFFFLLLFDYGTFIVGIHIASDPTCV